MQDNKKYEKLIKAKTFYSSQILLFASILVSFYLWVVTEYQYLGIQGPCIICNHSLGTPAVVSSDLKTNNNVTDKRLGRRNRKHLDN